jgi:hypothetical protein
VGQGLHHVSDKIPASVQCTTFTKIEMSIFNVFFTILNRLQSKIYKFLVLTKGDGKFFRHFKNKHEFEGEIK